MDINKQQFDFWYAVNHTEVLQLPANPLETFGSTIVNYHLLTEMMDSTAKVRVREGRIEAFKPQIVTPSDFGRTMLDGFDDESGRYMEWLQRNESNLMILKYGFSIKKQEVNDHILSEKMEVAIEQVQQHLNEKQDPIAALLVGVEEPWEVCLLKLMVETIQRSARKHVTDLRNDPNGRRHEIDQAFLAAAKDPSTIPDLSHLLQKYGLFDQYQDRFFSLVRH